MSQGDRSDDRPVSIVELTNVESDSDTIALESYSDLYVSEFSVAGRAIIRVSDDRPNPTKMITLIEILAADDYTESADHEVIALEDRMFDLYSQGLSARETSTVLDEVRQRFLGE